MADFYFSSDKPSDILEFDKCDFRKIDTIAEVMWTPMCIIYLYYLDDVGWSVKNNLPKCNYFLQCRVLELLVNSGLVVKCPICKGDGRDGYGMTVKGHKFLKRYHSLRTELESGA